MHFTRTAVPVLAFASLAFASSSSNVTPAGGEVLRRADGSEVMQIDRRGLLDGISCLLGSCNYINTNTNINNCGAIGRVCPGSYPNGAGSVFCGDGQCQSLCSSGFSFSVAVQGCINTNYDPNNCGSIGRVCSISNAVASCALGSCQISSCQTGFKMVNGACSAINVANDPINCGSYGNVCGAGTGVGTSSCVAGKCSIASCTSGFTLNAAKTACSAINTQTDTANCGTLGKSCPTGYSNGVGSICSAGVCQPTNCVTGYTFDATTASCRGITDNSNCGAIGKSCSVANGVGTCVNGACSTTCSTGYKLVNGACSKITASQGARVKKSKIPRAVKLCPGAETACPITGSASFLVAQAAGFSAFRLPDLASMVADGGYECLDTQYAIESCGGCASMGEGKNCLSIPRAAGVGCNSGSCVVFSCEAGFKPNFDSTGCVKAVPTRHTRRAHSRRGHGIAGHIHAHASS